MKRLMVAAMLCAGVLAPRIAAAQGDPFLGEIRWVGFNFAPQGWARCDGQLMQIAQNTALFSLLGTTYGGNGQTTFALPDMRGRVAVHQGQGPGLSPRDMGEVAGEEAVALSIAQMPAHTHAAFGSDAEATVVNPFGAVWGTKARVALYAPIPATQPLAPAAIGNTGGGQPHDNMPPFNTLNCIIALQGIYPARS